MLPKPSSMQLPQLEDESALLETLEAPDFWLLKHSKICPVSSQGKVQFLAFLVQHPELPAGWIDVIASRALSARLAELTGIQHESPQVLRLRAGKVIWHASHGAIQAQALETCMNGKAQD